MTGNEGTPRYTMTAVDRIFLPMCNWCGSLVSDSEKHDQYHQTITETMLMLTERVVTTTMDLEGLKNAGN